MLLAGLRLSACGFVCLLVTLEQGIKNGSNRHNNYEHHSRQEELQSALHESLPVYDPAQH